MRLNAYLAQAGIASRRKADDMIKAGQVLVNGQIGQLNDDVSDQDEIKLNGEPVTANTYRYLLLNKPAGVVTTMDDPQARAKVTDLVDLPERVVPVGRLDRDTTGALIMTNDGQLAHKLMHPSGKVDKVYEAEVAGNITADKLNMLSNGMDIDGQRTAPALAKQISNNKVELTIHEGRNHQVKKMLAKVDLPVQKLHRSKYGPLTLDGLKPGQWRELSEQELKLIK